MLWYPVLSGARLGASCTTTLLLSLGHTLLPNQLHKNHAAVHCDVKVSDC
jgi:hypothetical protein